MSIAFVGHSFVRRLENFESEKKQKKLNTQKNVIYHHRGGCTIEIFYKSTIHFIYTNHLNYVILDIGTNELSKPDMSPILFLSHLSFMVNHLLSLHFIKSVFILPIFSIDLSVRKYACREDFESVCVCVNEMVAEFASSNDRVHVWRYLRMEGEQVKYICNDGVHLNECGLKKYYRNVRGLVCSL